MRKRKKPNKKHLLTLFLALFFLCAGVFPSLFTPASSWMNMRKDSYDKAILKPTVIDMSSAINQNDGDRKYTIEEMFGHTLSYTMFYGNTKHSRDHKAAWFFLAEKDSEVEGEHIDDIGNDVGHNLFGHITKKSFPNVLASLNSTIVSFMRAMTTSVFNQSFICRDPANPEKDAPCINVLKLVGGVEGDGKGGIMGALTQNFFIPLFVVAVVFAAFYIAWQGIGRKKYRQALGMSIWVVVVLAIGLFVMAKPFLVARAPQTVTNTFSSCLIAGLSGKNCFTGGTTGKAQELLIGPECVSSSRKASGFDETEYMVNGLSCAIWKSFVLEPWIQGQFGVSYSDLNGIAPFDIDMYNSKSPKQITGSYMAHADFSPDSNSEKVNNLGLSWLALIAGYGGENPPEKRETKANDKSEMSDEELEELEENNAYNEVMEDPTSSVYELLSTIDPNDYDNVEDYWMARLGAAWAMFMRDYGEDMGITDFEQLVSFRVEGATEKYNEWMMNYFSAAELPGEGLYFDELSDYTKEQMKLRSGSFVSQVTNNNTKIDYYNWYINYVEVGHKAFKEYDFRGEGASSIDLQEKEKYIYSGPLWHREAPEEAKSIAKIVSKDPIMWRHFAGKDSRVPPLLIGMISSISVAIVTILISLFAHVYSLVATLLLTLAPFFLLMAVHYGRGRRIFFGWLELVIANTLKYMASAVLLLIILVIYSAVLSEVSGLLGLMIVLVLGIAANAYRKGFIDLFSQIDLGGERVSNLAAERTEYYIRRFGVNKAAATLGHIRGNKLKEEVYDGQGGTKTVYRNPLKGVDKTLKEQTRRDRMNSRPGRSDELRKEFHLNRYIAQRESDRYTSKEKSEVAKLNALTESMEREREYVVEQIAEDLSTSNQVQEDITEAAKEATEDAKEMQEKVLKEKANRGRRKKFR